MSPYAAGGLAMLAICVIYRYVPMWLALLEAAKFARDLSACGRCCDEASRP
jgi:hypothetical protein